MILSPQENEVPCLNCQVRYGKRPGEARNHGLVTVRSSLTVIAIHSLSAVDMELTADLYLYQVHSHTTICVLGSIGRSQDSTLLSENYFISSSPKSLPCTTSRVLDVDRREMLLPRPPAAGLGAHPVQRAGGHEPQGASEPLAARHTLPQCKGIHLNDVCTERGRSGSQWSSDEFLYCDQKL